MEQAQLQKIAMGAGLAAVLATIVTGRLPRWLRVVLVAALVVLACGAGLFAYRNATLPKTLTIAVGSADGDAAKLMSIFATRLTSTNSSIRLKVIDRGTAPEATKAFAAGETDLAIARADIGDLSAARAVLTVTYGVVLIVVPPGSSIADMDGLKGKTVGVVGGEANQKIVEALTKEFDLNRAKVVFKDLGVNDVQPALRSKQVNALLVVTPISEKYLTMLREFFPANTKQKLSLIPIDSAGAIAAVARAFESYELPKGTVRGSPPIPDDDLTTLRVPFYLVANKKLDDGTVTTLARAFMETRRDLLSEYPLLAQISAPSTDKDAYIPIHNGAAAYFSGDEKTFFDKHGDQFFYGSMLLGTLASLLAAIWKFMTKGTKESEERPLVSLSNMVDRIGNARSEADLAEVEQSINGIIKVELQKFANDDADCTDAGALSLATHRLEHLIGQRRATLNGRSASAAQA